MVTDNEVVMQKKVFKCLYEMYHSQAGPALKRQSSGDSAGLGHPHPSLSRGASLDSPKVTLGEQMVLLIITVCVIISLVILGPAQPRKFFRPGERESSSLSSGTNPQGDAQDLVVVHPLQSNLVQFLQGNPAHPLQGNLVRSSPRKY